MATVQARIRTADGTESIFPVVVPDFEAVRDFAIALHRERAEWEGNAFGWHAEYAPYRDEPPIQSQQQFTPAEFCIGESGVWFFSLLWENGPDAAPVEFVDESGIVRQEAAAQ